MTLFNLFRRRGSAPVARERLQILLSYERGARGQSDLLALLREEILAAVTKHITVERENVQVRMDRGASVSTLAIDVDRPPSAGRLLAAGASPKGARERDNARRRDRGGRLGVILPSQTAGGVRRGTSGCAR